MTDGSTQGEPSQKKTDRFDVSNLSPSQFKPLFKAAEEISFLYSRFFSACGMVYSQQSSTPEKGASADIKSKFLDTSQCHFEGLLNSLWYLRAVLRSQLRSINKDLVKKHLEILDLFEYYLYFSLAWLHRNSEALLFMVQPFLIAHDGCNPYEVDMVNLKKLIPKVAQLLAQNSLITNIEENLQVSKCAEDKLDADMKYSVPDDEKWKILGTCLWQHMSRFMISNLNLVLAKLEDENVSGSCHRYRESNTPRNMDFDSISLPEQILLVTFNLCDLLTTTVTHISSYHIKQLAEFLWQKLENDSNVMTFEWLKQTRQSESNQNNNLDISELVNGKDNYPVHQLLWDHCADPKLIRDCFAQEKLNWLKDSDHKPMKGWSDLYTIMTGLHKTDDSHDNHEIESPVKGMLPSGHASTRSNSKDITFANIEDFQSPREIYKRNGELLEVVIIPFI